MSVERSCASSEIPNISVAATTSAAFPLGVGLLEPRAPGDVVASATIPNSESHPGSLLISTRMHTVCSSIDPGLSHNGEVQRRCER